MSRKLITFILIIFFISITSAGDIINPENTITFQKTLLPDYQFIKNIDFYYKQDKSLTFFPINNTTWDKFFKIDKCNLTYCRIVKADFKSRIVWIEYVISELIKDIEDKKPLDYTKIPVGVKHEL